ncbi:hypothetical protein PARC_a3065 [Pseudoalteromonas arctica A 37-1-2]|uniref:Uncharacterized protein n=1 Tax=Pseudoalteromonas arctica A 37-1-2 TaxID=1117313 RepID=A0A290S5W6_9GAMM|nr:hypothetical protein PARC_a3065 [Pseudoalteromonas arctica A 37-1-2]
MHYTGLAILFVYIHRRLSTSYEIQQIKTPFLLAIIFKINSHYVYYFVAT